ncbi:MAG TPA: thiamine pyrophosphate-binding protein [Pirellulales bacterium]
MDYPAEQVVSQLQSLAVTHVVWLPDSAMGPWETAFENSTTFQLVRVCREGEAWAIAAGLYLAGCRPLVMIQNTGFFESGDAMRNVLYDLKLPLAAVIGYRSYLVTGSTDTARYFTEPVLKAWGLDYAIVHGSEELPILSSHLSTCRAAGKPGVVLIAEGRM